MKLRLNDPILKIKSKPYIFNKRNHNNRINEMFKIMYESKGIGLAGIQIGWPVNIFITNIAWNKENERIFINPTILESSKEETICSEGCLSLPGVSVEVKRPKSIKMSYYNLDGLQIVEEFDGLQARCNQHEQNHLMGIILTDKTKDIQNYKPEV